jgi:hypothetical protein
MKSVALYVSYCGLLRAKYQSLAYPVPEPPVPDNTRLEVRLLVRKVPLLNSKAPLSAKLL